MFGLDDILLNLLNVSIFKVLLIIIVRGWATVVIVRLGYTRGALSDLLLLALCVGVFFSIQYTDISYSDL